MTHKRHIFPFKIILIIHFSSRSTMCQTAYAKFERRMTVEMSDTDNITVQSARPAYMAPRAVQLAMQFGGLVPGPT